MAFPRLNDSLFKTPDPKDLAKALSRHACVAIILRGPDIENLDIAFIQRAINAEDRWSGQLAFPGGKREKHDQTHLDAALRETHEEVGIQLIQSELLGQLDDVQARKAGALLDFYIRPFVFHSDRDLSISLDTTEVMDFFWVPLKYLEDPHRQTSYQTKHDGNLIQLPAVHLDREPPLWGLTYLMTLNLMNRLNKLKT